MKTIGMIGGLSLEGTMDYYRLINAAIKERLGEGHSAQCLITCVDCHDMGLGIAADDWHGCARLLVEAGQRLERGGADFMILCTNTMHRVAVNIARGVSIPLLHIADTVRDELLDRKCREVGLIGTRYTMEQEFNNAHLTAAGIKVRFPEQPARDELHRIIFEELHKGIGKDSSREFVIGLLDAYARMGMDAIVMGCTEIGLLVDQEDTRVPLVDATRVHAARAADMAAG